MNNINVMQITGEFLSVEDIEKRFTAQSSRIAELETKLQLAQAQCAEKHEALQHCLECSSEPEKYGRYLSNEDREIIRKALSTNCGQDLLDKLAIWKEDTKRLNCLRNLMGCVQAGEGTEVKLFQDDATYDYFIRVGKDTYYFGKSLREAIDQAIRATKTKKESQ